jgi:hypothetical protein
LPFVKPISGDPLTVLEAVVQQTGIYAPSRKGRLSVFWGDQVFLPSVDFTYTPTHHVDIMCTLLGDTAPTAEEWAAQGLDKYGVIAVMTHGEAAQVDKVDHATATKMLERLGTIQKVGPSLGSFSVSASILQAMVTEFGSELEDKQVKMDTDPHFWMPLTLSADDYVYLMSQKGIDEAESQGHYERMKEFSAKFEKGPSLGLFGAVDVGKTACWWDYGQLPLYSKNSLLLLEDSNEADLLRKFLSITDKPHTGIAAAAAGASNNNVELKNSYAFASKIQSGTVQDSIVCRVTTRELEANGAIIVNCVAPKIVAAKGAILYNLISEQEIVAKEGQVMVEVTNESGGSFVLNSRIDIDGGKAWKTTVEGNELSFEQVHKNNKNANISKVDLERTEKYVKVANTFGI